MKLYKKKFGSSPKGTPVQKPSSKAAAALKDDDSEATDDNYDDDNYEESDEDDDWDFSEARKSPNAKPAQ